MSKQQLDRRLKKLEAERIQASLRREAEGNGRQHLKQKLDRIRERMDAARARGEEVPTASLAEVKARLRAHFGEPHRA
jgi:hypothetical protein